jgi:acetoacetyl-CoA synthetase
VRHDEAGKRRAAGIHNPWHLGGVLHLGPLAAALAVPTPVYAVKPRGIEEGEIPCQRIEEMAEYSIGVIKTIWPRGPYLLVGFSMGGLVALEMAQQLSAAGHDVPLVVLLDTYPSRQTWPLRCDLEILTRHTIKVMWSLKQYRPMRALREVIRRIHSLSGYLAASGVKLLPMAPIVPGGTSPASRRVHLATFTAGEAYRPSRYPGKVVFIQPGELLNPTPRAPTQVWRKFLLDLEVRRVPGTTHLGLVEAGAADTAAEISNYLAQAMQRHLNPSRGSE